MFKKCLAYIRKITALKTGNTDKEQFSRCLRILGFGSLMSLGGFVGFALCGLIGGSFGLMLGFVAAKLLNV